MEHDASLVGVLDQEVALVVALDEDVFVLVGVLPVSAQMVLRLCIEWAVYGGESNSPQVEERGVEVQLVEQVVEIFVVIHLDRETR